MALQLIKISKAYQSGKNKQTVLKNLTIKFPVKGLVAIVGKSGCGKSTLLNIIAGIETVDSGSLMIDGHLLDKDNLSNYQTNYISYVYQFYNLIPALTVKENIILPASIKGSKYSSTKLYEYANQLKIHHLLDNYPDELSGGQKQRVGLLRAFLANTPILLADEPTGALNKEQSHEVMQLLKQYAKKHLVIIISHDYSLIKQYTSLIIDLNQTNINYDFNASKYHKYNLLFITKRSKRLFFYLKRQLFYQKNKLLMMFISQIFIIIAFVLLISGCNGGWIYIENRFESDPVKEVIEVYQNDYLSNHFDKKELKKFKQDKLIDSSEYKLDFSAGKFQDELDFQAYQLKKTNSLDYYQGKYPVKNNQVMINLAASKEYDLQLDDQITFKIATKSYSLTISAIINDEVNNGNNIYFDCQYLESELKELLLNKTCIVLTSPNYKAVINKYQNDFLMISYHQEYVDSYQMIYDLAIFVVTVFIAISFIISIILITIILKTIFIERKKDTSLLLVNGLSKLKIVQMFAFEAMMIGMIIGFVGGIVAYLVVGISNLLDLGKQILGISNLFVLPDYFFSSFDLFILLVIVYGFTCFLSGIQVGIMINRMDPSILLKEN
ncbi:ABC transporter ATP-binding protein [Thomasclavelia sp.]|uniref:ABC transporter ATP-binding protein/permease n=1 Tax=Thomasclavelia sp. TaxID=3025757 RepID=UPI0025D2326F|nr:ABC transporter ATP-binding protein [Thomasclavelia sp.]